MVMAIRKIPANTKSFKFYNANPKDRRTGDCVIRAICTAMDKSWDDVAKGLFEYVIKDKVAMGSTECYSKYLADNGWAKQKQPKKADGTKYTGVEFVKKFKGTCVAHIGGNHIVCIKDGKVIDTWDSTDGCIGNYWTKE
jgi:hypothetical protein